MILDILRITIDHDGPMVTTDPNGFAVMAMIPRVMTTLLRPVATLKSDASGQVGCVVYTDADGAVALTTDELMRLAGLRLTELEYFALSQKFGIRHQWHEDFYDPETGVAQQPRTAFEGAD